MTQTAFEELAASYSALAVKYIDLFGSIEHTHPDDLSFLARHLGHARGAVIDAGCGPGHLTAYLASLGVDAEGIDLVPEFISHAQQSHPATRFSIGSLLALPVAEKELSGILAWYSLIHLDPQSVPKALAEFHRAVRPGGVLVLGFFPGEQVEPFPHKVTEAFFWPIDEMTRVVEAAGFAVKTSTNAPTLDNAPRLRSQPASPETRNVR